MSLSQLRLKAAYKASSTGNARWVPRLFRPDVWLPARFSIGECLYREKSGILGMLAATSVLVALAWRRTRPAA